MIHKVLAEFFGTFILVFFGVGSAVLMGDQIGFAGVSLAFGLAIVAAAYGFGAISGANVNPAVSFGLLVAGRLRFGAFVAYVLAQVAGAIAAAGVIYMIATGAPGYDLVQSGLGQNGWGPGYNGEYDLMSALAFEFMATLIFVLVILGATQSDAPAGFGGLAIGLTLTGIHLVGINVTGVSVNPARSVGPALFVGGQAIQQLWLFIVAPMVAGGLAGILHGTGVTRTAFAHPTGEEQVPPRR